MTAGTGAAVRRSDGYPPHAGMTERESRTALTSLVTPAKAGVHLGLSRRYRSDGYPPHAGMTKGESRTASTSLVTPAKAGVHLGLGRRYRSDGYPPDAGMTKTESRTALTSLVTPAITTRHSCEGRSPSGCRQAVRRSDGYPPRGGMTDRAGIGIKSLPVPFALLCGWYSPHASLLRRQESIWVSAGGAPIGWIPASRGYDGKSRRRHQISACPLRASLRLTLTSLVTPAKAGVHLGLSRRYADRMDTRLTRV